jgi:hypothetical protein
MQKERLMDTIESAPVQSNLIVDLVHLAADTLDVLVLRIDLVAHCSGEFVETTCCSVEEVYVLVYLILHGFVFRVG